MDVERIARSEALCAAIALTTTLALGAAAIAAMAGASRLFLACFGVAALGVASYGLRWIVTAKQRPSILGSSVADERPPWVWP
jgi:hypothetical protein